MAQPALESFKKRGCAIKAQPVAGTDPVPTGAANGFPLFDGTSGTEFDKIERPIDRPFFTNDPFLVANKRAFIEGRFELYPPLTPGAAATSSSDHEVMLLSAGMAVTKNLGAKTTIYNPISAAIPLAAAYFWHVDTVKKITDARTAISQMRVAIGERASGQMRLQGPYTAVTTEVLPVITLPSTIPVVATHLNSTCNITVAGGADILVWSKELSVDFGSTLLGKEYTSKYDTSISDRRATWSLRIARTDMADFNPWAVRDAASLFTARFRTLDVLPTGIYTQLSVRGQIEQINEVEIDGDLGYELSGPCIASNTGGDEFLLTLGDTTP